MNSSFTREQRENRIREIAGVFRASKKFRARPRPREDQKPGIAGHLESLIEGGMLTAGGLISSGLVREALVQVGWKVSESTVATVLWHLAQKQLLEHDGLYYKVPAGRASVGRLNFGVALKEVLRGEKNRAVFNLITAADRGGSESLLKAEAVSEILSKAGAAELNCVQRIRLSARNEKDSENQLVLVHRVFAVEYFFWKPGYGDRVLDEFAARRESGIRERRQQSFAFRPGNRKKWDAPRFVPRFQVAFREQYPDLMLSMREQRWRCMIPDGQAASVGLEPYGIVAEEAPEGMRQVLTTFCRAGTETILIHHVVLPLSPAIEVSLQEPFLRIGKDFA